jgi:hypothetical protein
VDGDAWDLFEVKSSTSAKDVHIFDLAFQAYVYVGAGLKVRRYILLLIDNSCVRDGEIDPAKFFKREDVTAEVSEMSRQIETRLGEMLRTIRRPDRPDPQIGPHCDDPHGCPLHDQCWAFLPEHNVLTLYRGAKKGFGLLAKGVVSIKDIPDGFALSGKQHIQRRVTRTGTPHVNKAEITNFLGQIEYPASYLDFETINPAIPLFDGTHPYKQVPFQFSLHVVNAPGSQPEHHSFLAEGRGDPRLEFLQRLRQNLPDAGSIIVYNAQFERTRLRECCDVYTEFQPWLAGVEPRLLDLLKPFRAFHYHAAGQHGSGSMKAVLPALTGRGYDHLAIQQGGTASQEFLRVTFGDVDEAERQRVRRQLEEYCGLDSEGMIWIVEGLSNVCR